jgi:hypothetical protein
MLWYKETRKGVRIERKGFREEKQGHKMKENYPASRWISRPLFGSYDIELWGVQVKGKNLLITI